MPSDVQVQHNPEAGRFEIHLDGHLAFLRYERKGNQIIIEHTEVPEALGGRGLGGMLAKAALGWARAQDGAHLVVMCPFVREYMRKHPE
jgi:predicted GNAT family acetyltransferase